MPAYNFQKRFAHLVENGRKKQTMRAAGRTAASRRSGSFFVGYTGIRTKACRKLVTSTITEVLAIKIGAGVYVDGCCLMADQANKLALADGFFSVHDMLDWFRTTHGPVFEGHIIRWR